MITIVLNPTLSDQDKQVGRLVRAGLHAGTVTVAQRELSEVEEVAHRG